MARQRIQEGAIVRIPLSSTQHTYGRLLRRPLVAIYDARTTEEYAPATITSRPVLFFAAVYDHAVTKGRWPKIGIVPLADDDLRVPERFIQDPADPRRCQIVDAAGDLRMATIEECEGLEAAAVWEPEHVEERIRDHYAGRKNADLEAMKLKR